MHINPSKRGGPHGATYFASGRFILEAAAEAICSSSPGNRAPPGLSNLMAALRRSRRPRPPHQEFYRFNGNQIV